MRTCRTRRVAIRISRSGPYGEEASYAAGAYEIEAANLGSTVSRRVDEVLGGTGVMCRPQAAADARRFESAFEPAAAAAAAFEETSSLAEAAAEARRQLLDNVNFANEYERKRQQQLALLPDAERALTKNYLARLDPAEGSWMHNHARKIRYGRVHEQSNRFTSARECMRASTCVNDSLRACAIIMCVRECLRVS